MSFEDLVLKSADRVVRRHVNVLEIRKGGKWDPNAHPRDNNGRFIERGGIARVTLAGGTTIDAKVDKINDDGTVDLKYGRHTIKRNSGEVEMVAGKGGGDLKEPDPPKPKGGARTDLKGLAREFDSVTANVLDDRSENQRHVQAINEVLDGNASKDDALHVADLLDAMDDKTDDSVAFTQELRSYGAGGGTETPAGRGPQPDGSLDHTTGPGDQQQGPQGGTLAGLRAQAGIRRPADTIGSSGSSDASPAADTGDAQARIDGAVQSGDIGSLSTPHDKEKAIKQIIADGGPVTVNGSDVVENPSFDGSTLTGTVNGEDWQVGRDQIKTLTKATVKTVKGIDLDRLDEIVATHFPERWRRLTP